MFESLSLELTHPGWMAVLLVIVPLLAWYYRRSLSDFPPRQVLVSLLTRCAIVALLAVGLSGLTLLRPTTQQFIIVAIDQSLSVAEDPTDAAAANPADPPRKSQVDDYLAKAMAAAPAGKHKIMYLPFAAQAGMLSQERRQLPQIAAGASGTSPNGTGGELDRHSTDLSAAIRSAAGAMPPDYVPRIVLLTDGNQTMGDALQAALGTASAATAAPATRASSGPKSSRSSTLIPIDTVPLKVRDDAEVQVAAVEVPA